MSSNPQMIRRHLPYLWNTETQLKSPLAHFALYSSIFGYTDERKGPKNGAFQAGPTMLPLFHTYLTVLGSATVEPEALALVLLTLIIRNKNQNQGHKHVESTNAIVNTQEQSFTAGFLCGWVIKIGYWGGKASVQGRCQRHHLEGSYIWPPD